MLAKYLLFVEAMIFRKQPGAEKLYFIWQWKARINNKTQKQKAQMRNNC
jgi:hypothetical protein